MDYNERVNIIAGMWEYFFSHEHLSKEDMAEFHREVREADVDVIDVLAAMREYD